MGRSKEKSSCGPHDHPQRSPERPRPSGEELDRAAAMFRALGDPARLKLLDQLFDGEQCVSELAEASGEGLSTVSQRLRILRGEGLVGRRRQGKHIFYKLADAHVEDLIRNALEHAGEGLEEG